MDRKVPGLWWRLRYIASFFTSTMIFEFLAGFRMRGAAERFHTFSLRRRPGERSMLACELARVLERCNDGQAARSLYQEAINSSPLVWFPYALFGGFLERAGAPQEALAQYRASVQCSQIPKDQEDHIRARIAALDATS